MNLKYTETHPGDGNSRNAQEYEELLEYDIKREREKNFILEERLKNKEIFIQQLKHLQEELTAAYEKCQHELGGALQRIQYLESVQLRQSMEQITELRHLLLRKQTESKRPSISKENRKQGLLSSIHNRSEKQLIDTSKPKRKQSRESTYRADPEPLESYSGKDLANGLKEVTGSLKNVTNFVIHFVQMASLYDKSIVSEEPLSKRLKKSWKWIKQVVLDWQKYRSRTDEHQGSFPSKR